MTAPLRRIAPRLCLVLSVFFLSIACQKEKVATPELQGIVELTERSLAFELAGRVLKVDVERGDVLDAGVSIASLDPTLEDLKLRSLQAEARATKAELDLLYEGTRPEEIQQARARLRGSDADLRAQRHEWERVQSLYVSDSLPKSELDAARSRLDQSSARQEEAREVLVQLRQGPRAQEIQAGEARLQAAEASAQSSAERIARHRLFSDGLTEVLDVPVRFGEFVSAGTTVVTVADTARPYVEVFVPQGDIGKVSVGMPVTVTSDSLQAPLGARVEHIGRALEYTPRFLFSPDERPYLVLRVRIRIADPERKIRAGVPAFVELMAPSSGQPLPPAVEHRHSTRSDDEQKKESGPQQKSTENEPKSKGQKDVPRSKSQ